MMPMFRSVRTVGQSSTSPREMAILPRSLHSVQSFLAWWSQSDAALGSIAAD
jgi:hypothetical protein